MSGYGLPILYALFVWWISTGLIMYLDGLPTKTFKWSMTGATAILAVSLYGLAATSTDTTVAGAFAAFTFGLLAWGWQAMSFYTGYITGPQTAPCPADAKGLRRFVLAAGTSIYHEVAMLVGAVVVLALTYEGGNQIGLWTYLILWWMHLSGKLNVFLGVPNLAEEFIPEHLAYLRSYMSRKPMNLLFPISVTVSTVITVALAQHAAASPAGSFEAVGALFLTTLMVLAVLEHWFLVVPIPAMALWTWSLKSRSPSATPLPPPTETVVRVVPASGADLRRTMPAATDPIALSNSKIPVR